MTIQPLDFDLYHPKPLIIVISGPSGVGKDATLQLMKKHNLPVHFVVTMTTRSKRPQEIEGVDYFFVNAAKFEDMIANGQLIEYAKVYDDYKGIPKAQIDVALSSGKDVILRLDVQGAATIRLLYPEAILIFLIPSNQDEWLQRLKERKSETRESFHARVEMARHELKRISEFDYLVVNSEGQLEQTVASIKAIVAAEHHKVVHRMVIDGPK
jgi:guanylate kinase